MSSGAPTLIGIDLGTYNSAACVLIGGQPVLLRPEEGATEQGMCFPSVVEFDNTGEFVQAGERARRSLPLYPRSVVWGVKRLIGRSYDVAEESGDIARYAYRIDRDADGGCAICVGSRTVSPREVTSLILQKIKRDAEADFNPIGRAVQEAVITVPAYFDPLQKQETERAALDAGFERAYLLPEPTAAASAYRIKVAQENQYVVVIDLGAGTLDVTVALLYLDANGQLQTVEKSHGGDTALGGLDMDDALLAYTARRFGLDKLWKDPHANMRLRMELERGKIELSTAEETEANFAWKGGPVKVRLKRAELEEAVRPTVERCRAPIQIALKEAGIAPQDIAHVLLVGGPTMMPIVQRTIAEEFRDNAKLTEELGQLGMQGFPVHPMEAVAQGAVLGVVGKVTPHGYGILVGGDYYELLGRRQRYPSKGSYAWRYWGQENTVSFSLLRQALNPQTRREEYIQLGVFEFDCIPDQSVLNYCVNWEYSDNGLLHLEVVQPGGVSMLLYDVSRLDGHAIAKPHRYEVGEETHRSVPDSLPARKPWSAGELQQAVRFGKQLLQTVHAKLDQAKGEQHSRIVRLSEQLSEWLDDEAADTNYRTPHIRDLGRALLNLLHVSRLIDGKELAALKQGL
jgi:molecular chaperone DnaK